MLGSNLILKITRIDEVYVALLLGLVFLISGLILRLRPSYRKLRQGFILACIGGYSVLIVLWIVDFQLYWRILRDNHVVEWLTAHFLIAAMIFAAAMTINRARRGAPSPLACFLAAGFFTAFWRELEWGEPFIGQRIWYGRHLFRPHVWFNRVYFEGFLQKVGAEKDLSVNEAIWFNFSLSIFAGLFIVGVSLYLLKHRKRFVQQLRKLHKSAFGRWFLAGLAMYIGAQIIEHAVNLLPGSSVSPFSQGRDTTGVPRILNYYYMRSIDEPLECLGAAAFWISTLSMWLHLNTKHSSIENTSTESQHGLVDINHRD